MTQQKRVILVSGIISAILGLLAGFLGGRLAAPPAATAPAVMRAESFQLVDQDGRLRGRWGIDAHGVARLALFGPNAAAPLVSLAADPQGGAHLELGDAKPQRAVETKTALKGSRQIALYHEGQLRLGLEVQRVCPVCGAPLLVHARFGRGRYSRLDHPSPPPLVPRDEAPEPEAQPPPRQAA